MKLKKKIGSSIGTLALLGTTFGGLAGAHTKRVEVQADGEASGQQGEQLRRFNQGVHGDEQQWNYGLDVTPERQRTVDQLLTDEVSVGASGLAQEEGGEAVGTVVAHADDSLVIEQRDGALIPVRISESTKLEGELASGQRLSNLTQLSEGDEVRTSYEKNDRRLNVAEEIQLVRKASDTLLLAPEPPSGEMPDDMPADVPGEAH